MAAGALTLSEPFCIPRDAKEFFGYTGFIYEDLLNDSEKRNLLENVDFLVDGPFIESQKSLMLNFRGSENQRIIDVKKSLETGETVVIDMDNY